MNQIFRSFNSSKRGRKKKSPHPPIVRIKIRGIKRFLGLLYFPKDVSRLRGPIHPGLRVADGRSRRLRFSFYYNPRVNPRVGKTLRFLFLRPPPRYFPEIIPRPSAFPSLCRSGRRFPKRKRLRVRKRPKSRKFRSNDRRKNRVSTAP